ncbi:GPI-anchor transamidase [Hondaea fermentalgiana]|uniref:GPI-anchor transamidase n=1 Tax=Hondaea fermentalgiana TaxID=2315210 RepID=A0A2R5GKP3_9STRA|nr:GPI-anchor transamidase [Hondaea fermentalgiana]|eukprot:GBG31205.1 GPI-anchor transamidase [Hondaea fermentalgiana]
MRSLSVLAVALVVLAAVSHLLGTAAAAAAATAKKAASAASESSHTNNWALIVDTSLFFFNYRHAANALSMYRTVKQLGIPDNQIILMLADDMACHKSNPLKAQIFNNRNRQIELYGDTVEVDYRGEEVTVENFLRVLLGRHTPGTPASKRLDTNEGSNIFIYMSGHGGDEFLKFQDTEELSSQDIAGAFEQMRVKKRFNEIFFAVDTCQAATMYNHFDTPGIVAAGSSTRNENSYSHHSDGHLGTAVIDRFTYYMLEFMDRRGDKANLGDLMRYLTPQRLMSTAAMDTSKFSRPVKSVALTDFLGSVLKIDTTVATAPYKPLETRASKSTDSVDPPKTTQQQAQQVRPYPIYEATF